MKVISETRRAHMHWIWYLRFCWIFIVPDHRNNSPLVQCNTIQYNTIQCNTMQYNTIQYNAMSLHSDTLYWFRALFFLLNQPKSVKWNQLKNTCTTPFHTRDIQVLDEKLVIILIIKVAVCVQLKFQIWCDSLGK